MSHVCIAQLKGVTPYSQSKKIDEEEHPKKPKEQNDAYDARIWPEHLHKTHDGKVIIPASCFGGAVRSAAARLQIRVPGKGQTTYSKYFMAGIQVAADLVLDLKAKDVPCEKLFLNANGKPGTGSRVYRRFPKIESWEGEVTFWVLDDMIPEDIFVQVLRSAGLLVGIGRFRPENRGYYGRFSVQSHEWIEDGDALLTKGAA